MNKYYNQFASFSQKTYNSFMNEPKYKPNIISDMAKILLISYLDGLDINKTIFDKFKIYEKS